MVIPTTIFIIALFVGYDPKKSLLYGLYAGIGLTGFSWIINQFTLIVIKIVYKMVNNTGIKSPIVDIGWEAGAVASFGSAIGLTFFIFGLLVEIILFATRITKVFMPSNLWNNFVFMLWGSLAFYVTHDWWLSLGLSFFMLLYTLLFAEIQADRWSTYYKSKNITVCSAQNIVQTIPAILLDPLWNRLGFNRTTLTPTTLKHKLGIFGESPILGAALGLFISLIANIKELNQVSAWEQIFQFTIQLSAVITIFPLIATVFNMAFTPLAEQIDKSRKQKQKSNLGIEINPIHDKKRWFLAVDDSVGYGESATIISGIVLIPIMLILAFLLPGNKTLPIVDLVFLPFMVESIVAITNGNILKVIATSIVWFSLGLYTASWLGPIYTYAIAHYGVTIPAGVILVTSFSLMAQPFNALIFTAFISRNPFWISLCIIIYLTSLLILRRYRPQIWTYLNKMAAKNIQIKHKSSFQK
ncbi:PTS galactitol transporter subunit IIC [Lactobacillus sp. JM1]|uniref:PTS galactitol transporter subunit IIC n=1 Tax=Lactobacillus gasseri TaxID=1596 RepID=A0AB33CG70_LACGS|nr:MULTISPECIES: PTS transporter subunit IIC [Lactobacillus]QHC53989.1 PTS galactitol transporter subunit IIC [Lactobacillus sp. JM1]ART98339.1 PTS galactitol transporter subunit IIC [Lactobacillus gasseri]MBO3730304.1 PTS galactitol transporter subunit IIC [Lactobacillus paragasseri]MCT7757706.1 PTS galactitol transporter subunit IIC [Lactobacillus gasseri]MDK7136560.1 PTS transporter subunit IIC [Lactobacillus paragasseri]